MLREMTVECVVNPGLEKCYRLFKEFIGRGLVTLLVAECEISYEGRASSKLGRGERLIIFKPDGSLLVHRSWGYEPVNWQPSGSIVSSRMAKDSLIIRSARRNIKELIEIRVFKVKLLSGFKLVDKGEFVMYGTEEDMKRAIEIEPSLLEKGFRVTKLERKVRPGFIDIMGVDSQGRLTIVELKRETASRDAVIQLKKYLDSLKRELGVEAIRGILAAPRISKSALRLLRTLGLEYKPISLNKCLKVLKERRTTL